jgi:transposase
MALVCLQAQAQNVLITCADEFRTSMTCCQCGAVGQLDSRSFKCENCGQERDRDHNGASNIARAALELIKGAQWPKELTREDAQK